MTQILSVPNEPKKYLVQLTSIRGIACIIVLVGHVVQVFRYDRNNESLFWRIFSSMFNAEAAVLVFFVLSGCVLSLALRKMDCFSWEKIGSFYVQRVFRIYPLLCFSVLLSLVCVVWVRHIILPTAVVDWVARNLATPLDVPHIVLALMGVFTRYNGPMWSLRVELLFSILFPFMLLALRKSSCRVVLVAVCFGLTLFPFPDGLGPQFALAFSLGSLIVLQSAPVRHCVWVTWGSLLGLLFDRQVLSGIHVPEHFLDLIETVLAFFLVRNVYYFGSQFSILKQWWIVMLGELSYSVYLLHLQVLLCLFAVGSYVWGSGYFLNNPALGQIGLTLATIFLTVPLSWFTYRCIELPLHRMGRRIARSIIEKSDGSLVGAQK